MARYGKQMTEPERIKCLAWKEAGLGNREISQKSGRPIRAIQNLFKRQGPSLDVLTPRKTPSHKGKTKLVTPQDLSFLRNVVLKNPRFSANNIKRVHHDLFGHLTCRYLQKLLKEKLKIPSRCAAKKPMLTARMVKKRLAFARKHLHWTEEDWSTVMFSDESSFQCVRTHSARVRRPVGVSRYDPRFTVKTVKHGNGSAMAWGCFSSKGRGDIYFLGKGVMMNQRTYKATLEEHLIPNMTRDGCTHFLQDGAPCHTALSIKEYLRGFPFEIMDWPGNSPDLNPIENCWNFIKDMIGSWDTISIPKLLMAVHLSWQRIPVSYFKELSDSMPRRMAAVIAAKGEMTKY